MKILVLALAMAVFGAIGCVAYHRDDYHPDHDHYYDHNDHPDHPPYAPPGDVPPGPR